MVQPLNNESKGFGTTRGVLLPLLHLKYDSIVPENSGQYENSGNLSPSRTVLWEGSLPDKVH